MPCREKTCVKEQKHTLPESIMTYIMTYHSAGKIDSAKFSRVPSWAQVEVISEPNACECTSRVVKGSVCRPYGHDSSSPISSRMFCCDSSQRPYSSQRQIFQNPDYISPF